MLLYETHPTLDFGLGLEEIAVIFKNQIRIFYVIKNDILMGTLYVQ